MKKQIMISMSVGLMILSGFYLSSLINATDGESSRRNGCQKAEIIKRAGFPNFHRVSKRLYRGAQPKRKGMWELKKMGVKSVLNLRSLHPDKELLKGTGLKYYRLRMKAWHAEEEDVVAFLKIVNKQKNTPLFVHCEYGADRTGMLVAFYRIIFCGWSKEKAIQEMTQGGFDYHIIWSNLVTYIRKADIETIKEKAGIIDD